MRTVPTITDENLYATKVKGSGTSTGKVRDVDLNHIREQLEEHATAINENAASTVREVTADFTVLTTDVGNTIKVVSDAPVTATLPASLANGTHVDIAMQGLGRVTFAGSGGGTHVFEVPSLWGDGQVAKLRKVSSAPHRWGVTTTQKLVRVATASAASTILLLPEDAGAYQVLINSSTAIGIELLNDGSIKAGYTRKWRLEGGGNDVEFLAGGSYIPCVYCGPSVANTDKTTIELVVEDLTSAFVRITEP